MEHQGTFAEINDDDEFSSLDNYIYPNQLEKKLEHQGEHAWVWIIYLYLYFIVHMPYLSSNIATTVFYGSMFSEFLRIAQCTLKLTDFVPKASQFCFNSNIRLR